jgi:hypothetical protein
MAYIKHKAKWFNPELDDFEYFKFKGDLMILEKYRYISAQIMVQRAKLNKLINAILAGTAYSSLEVETKVNELNKRAEILASRANLVMSSVDELEASTAELKKGVLSEEILRRYAAVRDQIIKVEKAFGKLASMRAPELFESLMRDLENIANRVRRIEGIAGESADLLLKNRLAKAKRYVKLFEKGFEQRQGAEL